MSEERTMSGTLLLVFIIVLPQVFTPSVQKQTPA